jgi:HEAT repeat protein
MKRKRLFLGLIVGLVVVAVAAIFLDPTYVLRGTLRREVFFRGRPASYWSSALKSTDPATQEESLRALSEGGSSAVPVLVALLNDKSAGSWGSAEVRWRAADILGRLGPEGKEATPALMEALSDKDMHVRTVVAGSLAALGQPPPEAIPHLVTVVEMGDLSSAAAAKTLSLYGPEARVAIPALLAALKAKEGELRWNAARTLGKIGPKAEQAVPALVAGLKKDSDPLVREHCAESLGEIGAAAGVAVPDLIAALKDPAPRVRRDSARALGQIGPPARPAVPMLKDLLKDKDALVRKAAERSLQQLAGSEKGGTR